MGRSARSILLVEHDAELRERIGGWLEGEELEVYVCPGPSAPTYQCVASQGYPCPLVDAVDLVLLDLWLASDSAMMGTSASQLLSYYLSSGKPVVVVDRGHDELRSFRDEVAAVLESPPERRDLLETVKILLTPRSPDVWPDGPPGGSPGR